MDDSIEIHRRYNAVDYGQGRSISAARIWKGSRGRPHARELLFLVAGRRTRVQGAEGADLASGLASKWRERSPMRQVTILHPHSAVAVVLCARTRTQRTEPILFGSGLGAVETWRCLPCGGFSSLGQAGPQLGAGRTAHAPHKWGTRSNASWTPTRSRGFWSFGLVAFARRPSTATGRARFIFPVLRRTKTEVKMFAWTVHPFRRCPCFSVVASGPPFPLAESVYDWDAG